MLIIIFGDFVYDNQTIGTRSVVYIFHKGIISYVRSCYEVQMNMYYYFF